MQFLCIHVDLCNVQHDIRLRIFLKQSFEQGLCFLAFTFGQQQFGLHQLYLIVGGIGEGGNQPFRLFQLARQNQVSALENQQVQVVRMQFQSVLNDLFRIEYVVAVGIILGQQGQLFTFEIRFPVFPDHFFILPEGLFELRFVECRRHVISHYCLVE